jgi:hypothetical protein
MNDVKNSGCKLAADIVPYIYGELSVTEGSVFESHLLGCVDCIDEFAAVSNARYEVYDWKKTEFEPLATPVFAIPYGEADGVSWFDKVRAAFSQSWEVPGVAFAGIAIVSMFIGVFYFSGASGPDVAQENSNSRPTTVSPQPDLLVIAPPIKDEISGDELRPVPTIAVSTTQKRSARNARAVVSPRRVQARPTTTAASAAPRLNEFSEDEDTSLRLALLFDDVDTRD